MADPLFPIINPFERKLQEEQKQGFAYKYGAKIPVQALRRLNIALAEPPNERAIRKQTEKEIEKLFQGKIEGYDQQPIYLEVQALRNEGKIEEAVKRYQEAKDKLVKERIANAQKKQEVQAPAAGAFIKAGGLRLPTSATLTRKQRAALQADEPYTMTAEQYQAVEDAMGAPLKTPEEVRQRTKMGLYMGRSEKDLRDLEAKMLGPPKKEGPLMRFLERPHRYVQGSVAGAAEVLRGEEELQELPDVEGFGTPVQRTVLKQRDDIIGYSPDPIGVEPGPTMDIEYPKPSGEVFGMNPLKVAKLLMKDPGLRKRVFDRAKERGFKFQDRGEVYTALGVGGMMKETLAWNRERAAKSAKKKLAAGELDDRAAVEYMRDTETNLNQATLGTAMMENHRMAEFMASIGLDPFTYISPKNIVQAIGRVGKVAKKATLAANALEVPGAMPIVALAEGAARKIESGKTIIKEATQGARWLGEYEVFAEKLGARGARIEEDLRIAANLGVGAREARLALGAHTERLLRANFLPFVGKLRKKELVKLSLALQGLEDPSNLSNRIKKVYVKLAKVPELSEELRVAAQTSHQTLLDKKTFRQMVTESMPDADMAELKELEKAMEGTVMPMTTMQPTGRYSEVMGPDGVVQKIIEPGYGHPRVLQKAPKGLTQGTWDQIQNSGLSLEQVKEAISGAAQGRRDWKVFGKLSKKAIREVEGFIPAEAILDAQLRVAVNSKVSKSARARSAAHAARTFVENPKLQWRAATRSLASSEQAGTEIANIGKVLEEAGAVSVVPSSMKAKDVAKNIAEMEREFNGVKFVNLKTYGQKGLGKKINEEMIRLTSKPGANANNLQFIVPEVVADRVKSMYKLNDPQYIDKTTEALFRTGKVINEYFLKPVQTIANISMTVAMPAFHLTNAQGAFQTGVTAIGLKAADPRIQTGAVLGALANAMYDPTYAKNVPFDLADGGRESLYDILKAVRKQGGLGGGMQHYEIGKGADPRFRFNIGGGLSDAARTFVLKSGLQFGANITDDYMHMTAILGRLRSLSPRHIAEAIDFSQKTTASYFRASKMDGLIGNFVQFYNFNKFALRRNIELMYTNPARLTIWEKNAQQEDWLNSRLTPEGAFFSNALYSSLQARTVVTAEPEIQKLREQTGAASDTVIIRHMENPLGVPTELYQDVGSFTLNRMPILAKSAYEMWTGRDLFTGEEIEGYMNRLKHGFMAPTRRPTEALINLGRYLFSQGDFNGVASLGSIVRAGKDFPGLVRVGEVLTGKETRAPFSFFGAHAVAEPTRGFAYQSKAAKESLSGQTSRDIRTARKLGEIEE